MKKLFTLVALLAMVLGANAQGGNWEKVYSIDYSTYQGFPFYVMGYVPEFDSGYMTDFGANYRYAEVKDDAEETSDVIVTTQSGAKYYRWTEGGGWHQYFIADGIPTKIDGKYKVIAKVKASEATSININMGWGWGDGQQASASVAIPADGDFQEVEWEYSAIGGSSCNLVAQPGGFTGTIDWLSLEVYEWQKEGQRPKVWLEDIENGDASKSWAELGLADVKYNDMDNNFKVCAWGKERMVNVNDDGGWDPFPCRIEADPADQSNSVFVVHGQEAISESGAAWDNQFWIQSKHAWKSGFTVKIKFRYKASKEVEVETQTHNQTPSNYLIWHGIGNVTFKEDWQNFEKDVTFSDDMANGWSFAFNLNAKDTQAIDFYFDDLSWQYLLLDEGYFVSGINATTTTSYDDLDNAIQFEDEDGVLVATVGEKGNASSYVDQIMISTTRGDDQAFKGATLKPNGKIHNDPEEWLEYAPSTNAKLDLPGLGVWKVWIDLEYNAMAFEMLEGTPYDEPDPVAIVTNETNVVVNGLEREPTADEQPGDEAAGIPAGTGAPWDNQFFLVAKRALKQGETTVVKFKYKASVDGATSGTQCHGEPGGYLHWGAIGSVTFGTDWQDFENTSFTVAAEADGMKCIAFNLAEIKEACVYEFKDFQWYLLDASLDEGLTYENLIDAEGTQFFFVKEGAGTSPYQFGTDTGINNVTTGVKNSSAAIYNLSGQRVSNEYKGIVVKSGKKYVVK